MNPEIKQKWVKALRSGEYLQGTGSLRRDVLPDDNGNSRTVYCCLGVLCDLMGKNWGMQEYSKYCYAYTYKDSYSSTTLPESLRKEVDIYENVVCDLVVYNDSGYNFNKIADIIEERL